MFFLHPPLIGLMLGVTMVEPGGFGVMTELVEVETLDSLEISFLPFSLGIGFFISELKGFCSVVLVGDLSSTCGGFIFTAEL